MANLAAQTVIAEGECAACGGSVKVKVSKSSKAYYYCPHILPDGANCSHHERWGAAHSQQMQRNYLEARKQAKQDEKHHEEPSEAPDIQEHPSEEREPERAGRREPERDSWDAFEEFG